MSNKQLIKKWTEALNFYSAPENYRGEISKMRITNCKRKLDQLKFEDSMVNWEDTPKKNKKLNKHFKGLIK